MKGNVTEKPVRIAYICLCHMDPLFVARACKTVAYKDDAVFIHVDRKVDRKPFEEACKALPHVHFVHDTMKNYWGGFNSLIATMHTLQAAMDYGHFDRFVLLQGQDYPLVSNAQIHDFFARHSETEFCRALNISHSHHKGEYMKICGYYHLDYRIQNNLLEWFFSKLLNRFNLLGIPYRKRRFQNWDIYHGWAQFALTNASVKHVLDVYHTNQSYNRYMQHRFPPDELYIPTILYNSPFRDKIMEQPIINRQGNPTILNLTYFEYPTTVTVFKEPEDYQSLRDTGCLFVRKVNSTSSRLLDEIDRHIQAEI